MIVNHKNKFNRKLSRISNESNLGPIRSLINKYKMYFNDDYERINKDSSMWAKFREMLQESKWLK